MIYLHRLMDADELDAYAAQVRAECEALDPAPAEQRVGFPRPFTVIPARFAPELPPVYPPGTPLPRTTGRPKRKE
jgi:hypothetical protein